MDFECPKCKQSGAIEDARVPESGIYATCPQCNNKFLITREEPKEFVFEATSKRQVTFQKQGKPWRRYWARTIDTILLSLPGGFLLGLLFPKYYDWVLTRAGGTVEATYPIAISILPFILLFEAIILGATGSTFGKWLLNIKVVRKEDGEHITIFEALERNLLLWIKGLAFGLPVISIIPMAMAASRIRKNVTASWDDSISADVQCSSLSPWKVTLAVLSLIALLAINGTVITESNKYKASVADLAATGKTVHPGSNTANYNQPPIKNEDWVIVIDTDKAIMYLNLTSILKVDTDVARCDLKVFFKDTSREIILPQEVDCKERKFRYLNQEDILEFGSEWQPFAEKNRVRQIVCERIGAM